MPIGGISKTTTATTGTAKRPPWVKDKDTPADATTPSWTQKKLKPVETKPKVEEKPPEEKHVISHKPLKPTLKKQSTVKESPGTDTAENGVSDEKLVKPSERLAKEDKATRNLFKPKPKTEEKSGIDKLVPNNKDSDKKSTTNEKPPTKLPPRKPPLAKAPSRDDMATKKWRDPLLEKKKDAIDKTIDSPKGHTLTKNESLRNLLKPVPPPMPPPMPPKMPPPPEFKREPPNPDKLKKLEELKSRPRRRPDWSDMMKEVEEGKKLRKVVCNDRSSPVIKAEVVKSAGQFIFESEKESQHNELLKQIEGGIKLKKTKTNDRSKPCLEGLRKFRRQMTLEEQLQKSMSQANLSAAPTDEIPAEEEEIDEMDDIDKVRDDLQSTKQLLQMELRNKEAMERENKRLQTRITNLEAEVARERAIIKQEQQKTVISVTDAYDEKLVHSLKNEVERVKLTADDLEKKYLAAAEERDSYQSEVEELKRRNAELEKKLREALSNNLKTTLYENQEEPKSYFVQRQLDFQKQCRLLDVDYEGDAASAAAGQGIVPSNMSSRRSSHAIKQMSIQRDSSFEEEDEESSEEENESEEKKLKRFEKQVKNMKNKIRKLKMKQDSHKSERMALKMSLKNQQAALKEEKKKYKELKREVKKMADMMKEVGSGDEEEEEDDEEVEEEEKESESESESETEAETESETESESEPEDAPLPKKKDNLSKRLKRHENRCAALKKSNQLLAANVDRLKDDFNAHRDRSIALKKELDALIQDLE